MFPFDLSFLLHLHPAWYGAFTLGLIAAHDLIQTDHAILRNFPVIGHLRYFIESIGPELRQYLYMGDREEKPFDRVTRGYVYATAKGQNNKIGFGTQRDYSAPGEFHFLPSMFPVSDKRMPKTFTPLVIGPKRRTPYFCTARIGIADMSRGSISKPAKKAFAIGAKLAGIHKCTGEGGACPEDLDPDGLTFAEIGQAKFGYRTLKGQLDMGKVLKIAALKCVKAFHIKLHQGAKPGSGGILPKEKIDEEIAEIRGIPLGEDCHSPNSWEEFTNIVEMFEFLHMLQEETGKPVGIKIVVGDPRFIHLIAYCMKITGKGPDYIIIDGGEGGTGAAPVILADHVGLPIAHALPLVDNIFRQYQVRDDVVLISSGKVATAADVARHMAMGADIVHIARAFMLSIGCIMALKCHTNECPTGVATNNPWLQHGLDPEKKGVRAYMYAEGLRRELMMLMATCGITETWQFHRGMFSEITKPGVEKRFVDLFPYPKHRNGLRNPVTIHNLEEYRHKRNLVETIEIPTQAELEARLQAFLDQEVAATESVADDVRQLAQEAKLLAEHGDIIHVPDVDEDVVPYFDLLGRTHDPRP